MEQSRPMNHLDFAFFALGQTGVIVLTLENAPPPESLRRACRKLLHIYPLLRARVARRHGSWRLVIRPDDERETDVLFDDAFRVLPGMRAQTPGFSRFCRALLNQPFAPEYGLPVAFRYLPVPPATLIIRVHHLVIDGGSFHHLGDNLFRLLGGEAPPPVPVENPSLLPALLPGGLPALPRTLLAGARHLRHQHEQAKRQSVMPLSSRPAPFPGPSHIHVHHFTPGMNKLKNAAKKHGAGPSALITAALALAAHRLNHPGDTIVIPMQVDLRPFFPHQPPTFGNYLLPPDIRIPRTWMNQLPELPGRIQLQLRQRLDEIRDGRALLSTLLMDAGNRLAGRDRFPDLLRRAKAGPTRATCYFSNLGNFDHFNTHGHARLADFYASTRAEGTLLMVDTLDNALTGTLTCPTAEFTPDEMTALADDLDKALAEWV